MKQKRVTGVTDEELTTSDALEAMLRERFDLARKSEEEAMKTEVWDNLFKDDE